MFMYLIFREICLKKYHFAYTTQKSIQNSVDTGACRSARTSKLVYCKPAINLTEYTKKQYSRSRKIETPTENVYDTTGYESPKKRERILLTC